MVCAAPTTVRAAISTGDQYQSARIWSRTASEMAPLDPSSQVVGALRRLSSAATEVGRLVGATSSSGARRAPAAAAPATASGKLAPVATNTSAGPSAANVAALTATDVA